MNDENRMGLHVKQAETLIQALETNDYLHPSCPRDEANCVAVSQYLQ